MLEFTDGYQVFADDRAQWLIARPDGHYTRLGGPPEVIADLLTAIRERRADLDTLPALARELAVQLLERGVLTAHTGAGATGSDRTLGHVIVDGDNVIADLLTALLTDMGHVVIRADALTADLDEVDAIASCAPILPDTRWQQLDHRCVTAGIPWHRAYSEGDTLVSGPFTIPGRTASYRDTRGRLLAASVTPDELSALWRHCDSAAAHRPRVSRAGAAVLAGVLALDIGALLNGEPLPYEGQQLVFRPADGSLTRHPVLPLPRLAEIDDRATADTDCGATTSGSA